MYLNVYDLSQETTTCTVLASGYFIPESKAHEYPTRGVFEVKSCRGFNLQKVHGLGHTNLSGSEFRLFMEDLAGKYHGDTYHLILKNCNHFTNEVSVQLTGRPIPGWVNRLAQLGSTFNCVLPRSIQVLALTTQPDHPAICDDDSNLAVSTLTAYSELDEVDHRLLTGSSLNVAYVKENW